MDATITESTDERSCTPKKKRYAGRRTEAETEQIVTRFIRWVDDLGREFATVDTPEVARALEQRIRDGGREILRRLLEERLQAGIDRRQHVLRTCSHCGGTRRHRAATGPVAWTAAWGRSRSAGSTGSVRCAETAPLRWTWPQPDDSAGS
jgi:hypothetical protein